MLRLGAHHAALRGRHDSLLGHDEASQHVDARHAVHAHARRLALHAHRAAVQEGCELRFAGGAAEAEATRARAKILQCQVLYAGGARQAMLRLHRQRTRV